jgi:hypothetical protein
MDFATEESFCLETPKSVLGQRLRQLSMQGQITMLENLVLAQSRAIDTILARLVVVDKTYNPVTSLDWGSLNEGRREADRIEYARHADRVAEADNSSGSHSDLGDLHARAGAAA